MARAAKNTPATKKKNSIRVDFSGVETNSVLPEGEFIAKVKEVKQEESSTGNDYLAWQLTVVGGKHDGKTLYHNTSLQQQSLWATKRWLECLGVDVPDGEFDIDFGELEDMEIGVVIEHETYKGRTRSRVVDSFPAEDAPEADKDDEDDDKKSKKKGDDKKSKKKDADDLPSDEDVEGMGKAELRSLIDEHELDVEAGGTTSAMRRAVIKALAAKRDGDEEEEKEEKSSKKRRGGKDDDDKKSSKKVKKVKAETVEEADEDDLEALVEKHELDVKLDKLSNLRKKRAAVMDALEEGGLLEEAD